MRNSKGETMDMMDMTGVVVIWSVGVFGFGLGLLAGSLLWWHPKRHKTPEPAPYVPMPNGLHVMNEVKDVVEQPKPLARYEKDIVQVFIDMDKRGTMWNDPTD